jgi:hypothetical protein
MAAATRAAHHGAQSTNENARPIFFVVGERLYVAHAVTGRNTFGINCEFSIRQKWFSNFRPRKVAQFLARLVAKTPH